jgi:hypothetical protein
MSDSNDGSPKRRDLLKKLGSSTVASAGLAVTAGSAGAEESTQNPTTTEITGREKQRIQYNILRSRELYEYLRAVYYKEQIYSLNLNTDTCTAFRVDSETGPGGIVASIPVELQTMVDAEKKVDTYENWTANLIAKKEESSTREEWDISIVVERISGPETTPTIEAETISLSDSEVSHTGMAAEVSTGQSAESGEPATETTRNRNLQIIENYEIVDGQKSSRPRVQITNCGLCKKALGVVCGIGCSVSVGVPCGIITIGVTSGAALAACPVVVGAICSIPGLTENGYLPPSLGADKACSIIGFC